MRKPKEILLKIDTIFRHAVSLNNRNMDPDAAFDPFINPIISRATSPTTGPEDRSKILEEALTKFDSVLHEQPDPTLRQRWVVQRAKYLLVGKNLDLFINAPDGSTLPTPNEVERILKDTRFADLGILTSRVGLLPRSDTKKR